jgi:apolipoprotein D and lipocalin family protein
VILAALLVLTACAAPRVPAFRQSADPIWSAAAFAPGQITGDWRQVAGFAEAPGGCGGGGLAVTEAPGGLALEGTLCLDGRAETIRGLASVTGPGRLALPGQEDWWVLWVDSGYRTLAIGTPSGRFGFVLDREGGASDRLTAAREVFAFNGYDPSRFRPL